MMSLLQFFHQDHVVIMLHLNCGGVGGQEGEAEAWGSKWGVKMSR